MGLGYQAQLRPFLERHLDAVDFVEIVPDILWTDLGRGASPRYVEDPEDLAFLRRIAEVVPILPHSIGLSIGSAHRFDRQHVAQLARWYEWLRFPWHSDHLAFHLAEHRETELNLNLTMPLPLDAETLHLLVPRVRDVLEAVPVPFLLENNVYYFLLADQELDEAGFLSTLCRESGCALLLDLHNLYVNCRNHGLDASGYLERFDLERVVEIHMAGGTGLDGFYLDAHSGPSPEPVWELLEAVLPRCPNLGGVTFELFGSWFEPMGEERLLAELSRMRDAWRRHRPVSGARAS